jgi:REP-associated tyrosine transposase
MIKDSYVTESDLTEIPRHQRYLGRLPLAELFLGQEELCKRESNELICRSYLTHGYTLKEIAEYLGTHYTTISKVFNTRKN